MAVRIYADLPITAEAEQVKKFLIAAADAAGCDNPRVRMEWRGDGHELEMLVYCDAVRPPKEESDGEASPRVP